MLDSHTCKKCGREMQTIFCPFKKGKNGKLIYPPNKRFFKFQVCNHCKPVK